MKKVLSPISEPTMSIRLVKKAGMNPLPAICGMKMFFVFEPIRLNMDKARGTRFRVPIPIFLSRRMSEFLISWRSDLNALVGHDFPALQSFRQPITSKILFDNARLGVLLIDGCLRGLVGKSPTTRHEAEAKVSPRICSETIFVDTRCSSARSFSS